MDTNQQGVAATDSHQEDWHQKNARDERLEAGSRSARGKMVKPDDATTLLSAGIRPGGRLCMEGDSQKQADCLVGARAEADPKQAHDPHAVQSGIVLPGHLGPFGKGGATKLNCSCSGTQGGAVAGVLNFGKVQLGAIHAYVASWGRRQLARIGPRGRFRGHGAGQDDGRRGHAAQGGAARHAGPGTMAAAPRHATRRPGVDLGARVADAATAALLAELETWPKPGLVSHVDAGSHTDMDAGTFRSSAAAIRPFYADLAAAGAAGAGMAELRRIGLEAERAMLAATGGVNTHRGAIFGLGLLCAAAGAAWAGPDAGGGDRGSVPSMLGATVRQRWGGAIVRGPIPLHSHGTAALLRFGAGGARAQAAAGFPHVLGVGLPALRLGRLLAPGDAEAARVQAFFALLASVEDTNLLHRGGAEGLDYARRAAFRFLAAGGVGQASWRGQAVAVHQGFVARRLSPGGCADLLACTVFLDELNSLP